MSNKLDDFINILEKLEDLHIVSGWRWNERSRAKLDDILIAKNLKYFVDDYGNVILNCNSAEELDNKLSNGVITQIFQAHLDHPGGRLTAKISSEKGLYCARWLGGYSNSLEGRKVTVHDTVRDIVDIVKIEYERTLESGRFLYFYSNKDLSIEHSYLHFSRDTGSRLTNGMISSWALDDLIGVSSIINVLGKSADPRTIGLLTLDEEIGGYGLNNFANRYLTNKDLSELYLINIDMPEEDEDFQCDNGVRLRYEDKRCKYTEELVTAISSKFPDFKKVSLTRGGTEASSFIAMGYNAVSFAIPIRNLHNGSRHNLLIEESVSSKDALSLIHQLGLLLPASNLIDSANMSTPSNVLPEIEYVDHYKNIFERISGSTEYCDYLMNVANHWNNIHSRYGVQCVNLDAVQFDDIKKEASTGLDEFADVDILEMADGLFSIIVKKIAGRSVFREGNLQIVSFFKANFNASNIGGVVALSLDKIKKSDLKRVLCHEMSHWVCHRLYNDTPYNDYFKLFLSEGIACYLSREICNVSSAVALGMPIGTYECYGSRKKDLQELFFKIINGELLKQSNKSDIYEFAISSYPNPFKISKNNPLNKFGYYLGLEFIDQCLEEGLTIHDILTKYCLIERKLTSCDRVIEVKSLC